MPQVSTANPYASPSQSAAPGPLDGILGAPVTAELTFKGPMRRIWELRGGVDATLEWNAAWVTEYVTLNGVRVAAHRPIFFAPLFEFDVVTAYGVVAGAVELQFSRVIPIFVRGIRVRMDEETIYQEGRW